MSVPSIETKIYQAIKTRVASLPMASQYPIKWSDGPAYEPQATERYLRATWIPNQTQRMFIGSSDPHRRPGILQIDVFATVAQGSGVAREVAGQVAQHFCTDSQMRFYSVLSTSLPWQDYMVWEDDVGWDGERKDVVTVKVAKAPSVMMPFIGTHIQVPVIVELEANA